MTYVFFIFRFCSIFYTILQHLLGVVFLRVYPDNLILVEVGLRRLNVVQVSVSAFVYFVVNLVAEDGDLGETFRVQ